MPAESEKVVFDVHDDVDTAVGADNFVMVVVVAVITVVVTAVVIVVAVVVVVIIMAVDVVVIVKSGLICGGRAVIIPPPPPLFVFLSPFRRKSSLIWSKLLLVSFRSNSMWPI